MACHTSPLKKAKKHGGNAITQPINTQLLVLLSFCINNTRKCTPLWGEPDQIYVQNMEQLHAYVIRM